METWVSVVRPEPVVTVLRASVGWTCGSMNWKSDQVLVTWDPRDASRTRCVQASQIVVGRYDRAMKVSTICQPTNTCCWDGPVWPGNAKAPREPGSRGVARTGRWVWSAEGTVGPWGTATPNVRSAYRCRSDGVRVPATASSPAASRSPPWARFERQES
jgi:hypothetical protein